MYWIHHPAVRTPSFIVVCLIALWLAPVAAGDEGREPGEEVSAADQGEGPDAAYVEPATKPEAEAGESSDAAEVDEDEPSDSPPPSAGGGEADVEGEHEDRSGIEEIVVTARKREEKIQETPISITAFTERALEERGIRNITELTEYTPNLDFGHTAGAGNTAQIFIRGIGQEDGTVNAEQGVGVYIDGVYQTRALGSVVGLHDIQRVEILRGPQGTLFGKNAIGGAVSIITNQPGPEYGVRGLFEAGNLDAYTGFLMLNFPIEVLGLGDKLFVRGSVTYETRDGYVHDQYLDERFADHQFLGGRGALRVLPRDDLEFTVTYWQSKEDERNLRAECRVNPRTPADYDFIANTELGTVASAFFSPAFGYSSFSDECNKSHEYDTSTDLESNSALDSRKVNGTAIWDSPEIPYVGSVTVKSITGFQSLEQDLNLELDSTAWRVLGSVIRDVKHQQFSEELQFLGQSFDDRLDWILGGFWLRERVTGPPNTTHGFVPGLELGPFAMVLDADVEDQTHLVHDTYAVYLHGNFEATERVSVYAGVRYVHEKKTMEKKRSYAIDFCAGPPVDATYEDLYCAPWIAVDGYYQIGGVNDIPERTSADVSDSWNAVTGLLGARYQITDDVMLYGGYQRGFRSGGYNYIGDDAEGKPNAFDPEYLDGIEFGLKSTWFDRRLLANLTYFWNYHHDMQQRVKESRLPTDDGTELGFADVILNTGNATIQGAEIEFEVRPIEGLRFVGGLGLTFAKYKDFELLNPDETLAQGRNVYDDLTDNDFQHTPKINFSLLASYSFPVGRVGDLTAQASYYYRSKVHYHVQNIDALSQGKVGIYNARLSFRVDDWETDIALWCKNLFDRRYLVGGIYVSGFGMVSRFYSEPRTYGITLTQRFGGG